MLRRELRKVYRDFLPDSDKKDALLTQLLEERPNAEEIRGKKWKPKGQTGYRLTLALLVLLILAGGLYAASRYGLLAQARDVMMGYVEQYRQEQAEQETREPEKPTESTDPEFTMTEAYQQVVSKYRTAIRENWDANKCMEEDMSLLVTFLSDPVQLSAARVDLDEDGVAELLITDGNVIYDLYAYQGGQPVHILSGAERNSYALTGEKILVNIGSNGAASTIYTFYRYFAGNLIVDQRVIYDAGTDPEHPWYQGYGEVENAESITGEEAQALIERYPTVPIPCKPITEYT